MKRTSLATMIYAALCENAKESDMFMDYPDLGRAIFGNGYIPQTASIFDKMIKERMYEVRELAEQEGMIVIPNRSPLTSVKNSGKKFRIKGWKIATQKDEKYIQDELMYKAGRMASSKNAIYRLSDTAKKRGMLGDGGMLGIAM